MKNLQKEFAKLSHKEIQDILEGLCVKTEDMIIRREMTNDEKIAHQQELAAIAVKRAIMEEEFERVRAEYKAQDNPMKERSKSIVTSFRTNAIEMDGTVYHVPNQDAGNMELYDQNGNLLQMRPLLPEERQRDLAVDVNFERILKTGTDN